MLNCRNKSKGLHYGSACIHSVKCIYKTIYAVLLLHWYLPTQNTVDREIFVFIDIFWLKIKHKIFCLTYVDLYQLGLATKLDYVKTLQAKYFTGENITVYGISTTSIGHETTTQFTVWASSDDWLQILLSITVDVDIHYWMTGTLTEFGDEMCIKI